MLHGKQAFLRQLHTQTLRDALAKEHANVDTVMFDGESARPADVLDECRSFGLIAGYKLVIVDNADSLIKEDARPLFERFAQGLADGDEAGATLLLRSDTWRPGNLDKLIEKVGVVIKCEAPTEPEAAAWAVRRAKKRYDATLEPATASLLVERVGADLGRLDSELGKLAAAAGEGNPITRDLVAQFVGVSRDEEVWGIQRTLLGADAPVALAHLRHVLDVSRHPPTLVSWALTDLARKLHAASRSLKQGAQPGALMKPLKLWGPSADALLGAARATSPDRALSLFRFCIEGDRRGKSGLGDPERTLEREVLEFASLRRR